MGRQRHKREGDEARRVSVEAKVFILDLKRQKGILQGVIEERLGLAPFTHYSSPLKRAIENLKNLYGKSRVGDSTRIRFWFDHWCKNYALNQTFPTLFELVANN